MALPSNDKIPGDLGHADDHNAIVNEIINVKDTYLQISTASSTYLRKDSASTIYLPISASSNYLQVSNASVTYALLNSPTFTGTPLAPTAASGTNTTQIATTAFVRTEVSNLVAAAPSTLDTLNELAAALGNDANFSTTVTNSLALKAPLASPTFTGTPAAPTAAVDTNTTQVATTAYVIGQGYLKSATANSTYAPLASPTFTGIPLAPTAASTINNTQIATTAYVKTLISSVSGGSASVDLSGYLTIANAAATYLPISSSSNYVQVSNASATYALRTSPIFSGSVTLPASTYTSGNSSPIQTQIDNKMNYGPLLNDINTLPSGAGFLKKTGAPMQGIYLDSTEYLTLYLSTNAQTASVYTLTLSDAGKILEMNNAAANVVFIPLNASVAFPIGTKIDIIQTGAGATSASTVSGVTLNSDTNKRTINTQWSAASLVKRATDTWIMIGAIKA